MGLIAEIENPSEDVYFKRQESRLAQKSEIHDDGLKFTSRHLGLCNDFKFQ